MNKIIWFIGGFLLGVIVTVAAMKFGAYFLGSPQNDEIVVAATSSMPVGTILGYDNLGKRTVHGSQLPKDYIQPDEVSSLIGHKLIKTVEEKQVLTWRDVDAPNPMPLVRGDATVIAAASDLPAGVILRFEHLMKVTVPGSQLSRGCILSNEVEAILGHTLTKSVLEKHVLTWNDVDVPKPTPPSKRD